MARELEFVVWAADRVFGGQSRERVILGGPTEPHTMVGQTWSSVVAPLYVPKWDVASHPQMIGLSQYLQTEEKVAKGLFVFYFP